MVIGIEFFSGHLQKTQMSGRPYLQTQTGNLKRSWFVRSARMMGFISATLATNAKYAAIHQFGGVIRPKTKDYLTFKTSTGWVNTKKVKIPKRLKLFETFKREGINYFKPRIEAALVKVYS